MMQHVQRVVVWWMLAVAVHLPIPLCDGDNLKSSEPPAPGTTPWAWTDIDFVLLGCDLPDDVDDGPFDRDPENSDDSPFGPSFVRARIDSIENASHTGPDLQPPNLHGAVLWIRSLSAGETLTAHRSTRYFSYGKTCRNGLAVIRC